MKNFISVLIILIFCVAVLADQTAEKTRLQVLTEMINKYRVEPVEENFDNAVNEMDRLIKEDHHKGYVLGLKSYIYSLKSDYLLSKAEEHVKEMNFSQKFLIANMLLEKNDYLAAIEVYEMINQEMPKWSCPWRHKGEAYYRLEMYDKAEEALAKSIEVKEDHTDAYLWLAMCQEKLGKFDSALKSVEKGIILYEKGITGDEDKEDGLNEYYDLKGDILSKLGRLKDAEEAYGISLKARENTENNNK